MWGSGWGVRLTGSVGVGWGVRLTGSVGVGVGCHVDMECGGRGGVSG